MNHATPRATKCCHIGFIRRSYQQIFYICADVYGLELFLCCKYVWEKKLYYSLRNSLMFSYENCVQWSIRYAG
jgi:hypothetical protein